MAKRFSRAVAAAIDASSILGIRAGARSDHRFIGVWPVVVDGRVFARSWTLKKGGWRQAFDEDPRGTIQAAGRELKVRAVPAKGARLRDQIEDGYAAKFDTKASQKYVRGFRTAKRRDSTVEFVPR